MLILIIASVALASLVIYALTGGADFGGGTWDLLARGPRRERQRAAIAHAIGPIWEANHVWLILVIVILFTAFPRGFAMMMTTLHIPLTAMLIGIVLRGSTFVFRKYDRKTAEIQRLWSAFFGFSSVFTPIVQGVTLGALATGAIRVDASGPLTGYFAGWTSPFALACGLFAWVLFAFLAAVYLTVDAKTDQTVQEDFRVRALAAELLLAPIALVVFFTAKKGAPSMYDGLTHWWAPLLLAWTSFCALATLAALWRRRYKWARIAAVGQVTLILAGWCISQFPYLILSDIPIV